MYQRVNKKELTSWLNGAKVSIEFISLYKFEIFSKEEDKKLKKKALNKVLALAMAAVMAGSMAGCGNDTPSNDSQTPGDSQESSEGGVRRGEHPGRR